MVTTGGIYDPEVDSPEARANFATRHIRNLGERCRKRGELRRRYEEEEVRSGVRPAYFRPRSLENAALLSAERQARGGEDFPDLLEGEVEIARSSLVGSVHGEVTSLRARLGARDRRIHLRAVDEHGTEFVLAHASVDFPLAAFEILEAFRDAAPSPLDTPCQVSFTSYFYDDLERLAAKMGVGPAGST